MGALQCVNKDGRFPCHIRRTSPFKPTITLFPATWQPWPNACIDLSSCLTLCDYEKRRLSVSGHWREIMFWWGLQEFSSFSRISCILKACQPPCSDYEFHQVQQQKGSPENEDPSFSGELLRWWLLERGRESVPLCPKGVTEEVKDGWRLPFAWPGMTFAPPVSSLGWGRGWGLGGRGVSNCTCHL